MMCSTNYNKEIKLQLGQTSHFQQHLKAGKDFYLLSHGHRTKVRSTTSECQRKIKQSLQKWPGMLTELYTKPQAVFSVDPERPINALAHRFNYVFTNINQACTSFKAQINVIPGLAAGSKSTTAAGKYWNSRP